MKTENEHRIGETDGMILAEGDVTPVVFHVHLCNFYTFGHSVKRNESLYTEQVLSRAV